MQSAASRFRQAGSNLGAVLGRIGGTALLEIRLNLLSPGPWIMGLVLAALGYLQVRTSADPSSFRLGWALSYELGPLTGVLLLFLAGSLAHRPERYEVSEMLDSKPVGSEELIFGRWLGMVVGVLVPVVLEYAVTMVGQKIDGKHAVVPLAYAQSFGRLLPLVLFLSTLSFCLVAVTRILVLGAGLAGLVWFLEYFGRADYPSVLRMELTQNRFVFLGLTAAVLLWMLLGYRGRRRAKQAPVTYGLAALTSLSTAAVLVYASWVALAIPGKASALETWKRLRNPETGRELTAPPLRKEDPLPNFAWQDQHGKRVSLAGLRGFPALLVFFKPEDSGVSTLPGRLSRLRREMAPEELQVLGVCLSDDLGVAAHLARLTGTDLSLVTDWGTIIPGQFDPKQPPTIAAWALRIQTTPAPLLVERDGKELTRDISLDESRWDEVKERLRAALKKGSAARPTNPGKAADQRPPGDTPPAGT